MTKTVWTIIGIGALLLAAVFLYRSCDLYDELSVVRGQYEEAKRQAAADTALAEQMVKDAGEVIALQSEKISDLEGKVAATHGIITDKDKTLAALQDAYNNSVLTDAEKIANLEAQVQAWSQKFSLAESIINEQTLIIRAWEVKFNEQVKISDAWKLRYENEARLHSLCLAQNGLLEKKVSVSLFKSKIATTLVAVAGGYIVYDMIRSK